MSTPRIPKTKGQMPENPSPSPADRADSPGPLPEHVAELAELVGRAIARRWLEAHRGPTPDSTGADMPGGGGPTADAPPRPQ